MKKKEEKILNQLTMLMGELEKQRTSIDRVLEIKGLSLTLAKELDSMQKIGSLEGMLRDFYRVETKYPRRRVKAAINLLMESIEAPKEKAPKTSRKKSVLKGKDFVDVSLLKKKG